MVMEQLSRMGFTHYELMNMKGASYETYLRTISGNAWPSAKSRTGCRALYGRRESHRQGLERFGRLLS